MYVWMYLLLNATHKDTPTLFAGKKIVLKPGQLVTGRKTLSEKTGIHESKVRRILKSFENDHQIDRQISNQNSLISIRNWNKYQFYDQQTDQPVTIDRPSSDQPATTNKNVKNDKNEKKREKNMTPPEKQTYREFVKMTNAEYEALIERLGKEGAEACMDILDNYKGSSGKKYKSDYRAILSWVIDEYQKRHPTAATRRKNDVEIDL